MQGVLTRGRTLNTNQVQYPNCHLHVRQGLAKVGSAAWGVCLANHPPGTIPCSGAGDRALLIPRPCSLLESTLAKSPCTEQATARCARKYQVNNSAIGALL